MDWNLAMVEVKKIAECMAYLIIYKIILFVIYIFI